MNGPTFAPAAPAAAPKVAPPRPPAPPKAAAKPDPDAGNGLRVLTYLRLHWLMIAFCGTLVGAVASYAAWELLPSKYESTALLHVPSASQSLVSQGNRAPGKTDFSTYVKTALKYLKSEYVLNAALRDLKDLPTIKGQKEPLRFLEEEVMVSWADGSEVVAVTCKGHQPDDVRKIVDSINKAYLTEVVAREVLEKQEAVDTIEKQRNTLEAVLLGRIKKPTTQAAANPLGVLQPGAGDLANPAAPGAAPANAPPPLTLASLSEHLAKVDPKSIVGKSDRLMQECERLPMEIKLSETRLADLAEQGKKLKEAPISPQTFKEVDHDQDVFRQGLLTARAEGDYKYAHGQAGGSDAPQGVQNLKKIWEAQKARHQEIRLEKAQALEGTKRNEALARMEAEFKAEMKNLTQLKARLATATAQLQQTGTQLLQLPPPSERGSGLSPLDRVLIDPSRTDLATIDGLYGQVVLQHELAKIELAAPKRVKVFQPGSTPTQKDTRKQILATVFAGLMGYVVIALGVVAFETLGRRVSSLADLKSAGPAPVVGVIPCLPAQATGRDPLKRAAANEAVDKLRSYVAQTWLSRGATTIAVTSPLGDEGKAFTAFGLASSLAQAGYKTLVADFDLRDPALHDFAGVPNQAGVCEILRGEVDARSTIQALASGLDLLPAGKWSDEARKAAVGGRLETLLARLREPYDCVVLHGHALLTAAESVEVARRCEVVLVCAQYRDTTVPLLRKATDRVAAMEIPYSGVVYVGATEREALC